MSPARDGGTTDRAATDMPSAAAHVLFLCTGNYYRSRFAELVFNHHARRLGLPHQASSAGLAERCWERNPGALSPHTREALSARGIAYDPTRLPCDVTQEALASATLVIAVKEDEHRPMVAARFPQWTHLIEYWAFDDVYDQPATTVLPALEAAVRQLLARLAGGPPDGVLR